MVPRSRPKSSFTPPEALSGTYTIPPKPSNTRAGSPPITTRISTSSLSCCPSACIRISTTSMPSAAGPTIWATKSAIRAESLRLLAWWRGNWKPCTPGHVRHPVFVALKVPLANTICPSQLFLRSDQRLRAGSARHALPQLGPNCSPIAAVRRIPSAAWFCVCAATPTTERDRLSDATCTALQLANFWQDVTVDLEKDRVYLPLDLLARTRLHRRRLCGRARSTPAFQDVDARSGRRGAQAFPRRAASHQNGRYAAWRSIWTCSAAAACACSKKSSAKTTMSSRAAPPSPKFERVAIAAYGCLVEHIV